MSLYPSEDGELELDQIDYLNDRYPNHVIGLSTHEYHDWESSMLISYGKGARSWERHIDIDYEGVPVSSYCSKPEQCDTWFKAFHKAAQMCGGRSRSKRIISKRETEYLDALVRGAYAKKDLEPGYGPVLLNVVVDPRQEFAPRIKSRVDENGKFITPELDDMHPFLSPVELRAVVDSALAIRANA